VKVKRKPYPDGWEVATEFRANGRTLTRGDEFSVKGEPGRFRFEKHVTLEDGRSWIDAIGGARKCVAWRSFRPERVKTVHRLKKTLTASDARSLVNEKNRQKRAGA
jgi:hypothetical protein